MKTIQIRGRKYRTLKSYVPPERGNSKNAEQLKPGDIGIDPFGGKEFNTLGLHGIEGEGL